MGFEVQGIPHIDKEELKAKLNGAEGTVVLDVRQPEEYEEGHIPGVPLVPMGTIPEESTGWDKSKEYVFVCRSGQRSLNVALYLKDQGFEKVINYDGGMLKWDGERITGMDTK